MKFSGGKRTVTDGPFTETKELVAGFWLWQVKSLDEAVEWLRRAPFEQEEVEIRPLFELDDCAASDPSGNLRQQEQQLRQAVAARRS